MMKSFAEVVSLLTRRNDTSTNTISDEEIARTHNREQLYGLLCFVQKEIERVEQLFNFAEEEALIDNIVYTLKSLRAQQQYLVQNIRHLDGVGVPAAVATAVQVVAEPLLVEVVENNPLGAREGYALG